MKWFIFEKQNIFALECKCGEIHEIPYNDSHFLIECPCHERYTFNPVTIVTKHKEGK